MDDLSNGDCLSQGDFYGIQQKDAASPQFPVAEESQDSIDVVDIVRGRRSAKEETLDSYSDGNSLYFVGETVYIENPRSDMPYFISTIREFKKSKVKKDLVTVEVACVYRPCEIPTSVYQLLVQDRNHENGSCDHILEDPKVKARELFISDAVDTYPASAIRGHAYCSPFCDIKDYVKEYLCNEDHWFYILRYNPESRRMANAKGEIRIGASHQAILPEFIPLRERSESEIDDLWAYCPEELVWDPDVPESKVDFYLRAARSIATFNAYCEAEDSCVDRALATFSEDQTTANAYDMLHQCKYDISLALHELVLAPHGKDPNEIWDDDERKKFMRGLRSHGKTFFKICKELLPGRTTKELVHYYYLWKKTPVALNSRPHKRGRKSTVLARKTRASKPKPALASVFLDLSSCSENDFDSMDSDNNAEHSLYACRHCYSTKSRNWHHAGKTRLLLCFDCRSYFKRYGQMKVLKEEEKRDPPPFIYKAAFESLEEERMSCSSRMRTRRTSTPVFAHSASHRRRMVTDEQDGKPPETAGKQVSCADDGQRKDESADFSKEDEGLGFDNDTQVAARGETDVDVNGKAEMEEEDEYDRDTVVDGGEDVDEGDDADDELDADSEPPSPKEAASIFAGNEVVASVGSRIDPPLSAKSSVITQNVAAAADIFVEERGLFADELPAYDEKSSSSSDAPIDEGLDEKIRARFKHLATCDETSCSRTERVFIYQRPKKKSVFDAARPREGRSDHESERKRHCSPSSIPARITSNYDATLRYFQTVAHAHGLRAADSNAPPHGFWAPGFSVPPELSLHRPVSPHKIPHSSGKFDHFSKMLDRSNPDSFYRGSVVRSSLTPHSVSHSFPRLEGAHRVEPRYAPMGHISSHLPAAIESLSRISSGIDRIGNETVRSTDRLHDPVATAERVAGIDPLSGLPAVPHIHSHLHTHTHLHLHPEDSRAYRSFLQPAESHNDRQSVRHDAESHPPSATFDHDLLRQYPDFLSHDLRLREALTGGNPHLRVPRERSQSPSRHTADHVDPVAYHLMLSQYKRSCQSSQSSPLSQAGSRHLPVPDALSHGRHVLFARSEQSNQVHSMMRSTEHESPFRPDHEKHQHQVHAIDRRKLEQYPQPHLFTERHHATYRPNSASSTARLHTPPSVHQHPHVMHAGYRGSPFLDGIHRVDGASIQETLGHSERIVRDRAVHERIVQEDRRLSIDRQHVSDRSRHDRPSIFGRHRHPETIDLSEE